MSYCGKLSTRRHDIGTEFLALPWTHYMSLNRSQFSYSIYCPGHSSSKVNYLAQHPAYNRQLNSSWLFIRPCFKVGSKKTWHLASSVIWDRTTEDLHFLVAHPYHRWRGTLGSRKLTVSAPEMIACDGRAERDMGLCSHKQGLGWPWRVTLAQR